MSQLLASNAWALDIVFFVILLAGTFFGVARGFIKSVCKLAGTLFAVSVGIMFCVSLQNTLEKWFSLTTALANAIGNATIASIIAIVISFILLVILVKLGAWILGKVGTRLVEKFQPVKIVNRVLGGILGLFEAFMLIMLLLAICHWIPVDSLHVFLQDSTIVGRVFDWVVSELSNVTIDDVIAPIASLSASAPNLII